MRGKGFTLIELLAVIVILAIIALIATPIVIHIINDTKKSSNKRTAEIYLNSVELAITKFNMNKKLNNTICIIEDGGNLNCDGNDIKVDMNNSNNIKKGGIIVLSNGKIKNIIELNVDDTFYNKDSINGNLIEITPSEKKCSYTGELSIGTEVNCITEKFHVINITSNNTVVLLADKNITLNSISVQSDSAQTIAFSNQTYWLGENNKFLNNYFEVNLNNNYFTDVYTDHESETLLYNYVNNYKDYLTNILKIKINNARVINLEDAYSIFTNYSINMPEWIYCTNFWLGLAQKNENVWVVGEKVFDGNDYVEIAKYNNSGSYGIRPVVEIALDNIEQK